MREAEVAAESAIAMDGLKVLKLKEGEMYHLSTLSTRDVYVCMRLAHPAAIAALAAADESATADESAAIAAAEVSAAADESANEEE